MQVMKNKAIQFSLALLLLITTSTAIAGVPKNWTEGYVMANDIRIHYWRTGGENKPVIVMAHGFSDDGMTWTNLAKELEADYDIIMFDARAHGLTDPGTKSDPLSAQREDFAAFIKAMNLEKPIVMGHSMGSASAAWLAAIYPNIASAVILEDPRLIPRKYKRKSNPEVERAKRYARILERNNSSYDELLQKCIKQNTKWERSECEYWVPSKILHHPNAALRDYDKHPNNQYLFPKITTHTLILKADAKNEVERKENEEIAALLKNGKLIHVPGAGHSVRRDNEKAVVQAIKEFLSSVTK